MTSPRRPPAFRGDFHTDQTTRALYSESAGPLRLIPKAVAFPADLDDLALLLAWATATGTALTPRGAGSGMPGGNLGSGVIVDLSAFDRPVRVGLDGCATVGAAVTWGTLERAARHFGFRLPPDPSSGAFCTLGGMVATNAAGARSLRYGPIRRWVRGVEFVTTEGEVVWIARQDAQPSRPPRERLLGTRARVLERLDPVLATLRDLRPVITQRYPTTTKNTAGYALDTFLESGDVLDLLIGSEGTLGIITRVEVTLDRAPEATATLLLGLAALEVLTPVVETLLRHRPVAIELLDRTFLDVAGPLADMPRDDLTAVLLVELEGGPVEVAKVAEAAVDAVAPYCPVRRIALDRPDREALWALRHAASPMLAALPEVRRSLQVIEDGCVPVAALGDYLAGVRRVASALEIPVVAFGHAGDGHLHVNALADLRDPDMPERLDALRDQVTEMVINLGGTPSGEHGDGRLRTRGVERLYGRELLGAFRAVKTAFDPAGVLNPGVILPDGSLPTLKVGNAAPTLPDTVERAFRIRERSGAWGTHPLNLLDGAR